MAAKTKILKKERKRVGEKKTGSRSKPIVSRTKTVTVPAAMGEITNGKPSEAIVPPVETPAPVV